MTTTILAIVLVPLALVLLLAGLTVARYGADQPTERGHGESARQRERLARALELRGRVPDEFWPIVTRNSPPAEPAPETAPVR